MGRGVEGIMEMRQGRISWWPLKKKKQTNKRALFVRELGGGGGGFEVEG